MEFTPVVYDTFMLMDSNLDWKYDTNAVEIIDPDNKVITFLKPGNYSKGYRYFSIEYVTYDKVNCIRNGWNYTTLQSEEESWYSVNSPVEIHLYREARAVKPDSFVLDSLQYYHLGERFQVWFSNPYGSFSIPDPKNDYEIVRYKIEQLDTITLNGITWKDVTHVYYFKSPGSYYIYMKGAYLKRGTGLICFYSNDNKYWYLKI